MIEKEAALSFAQAWIKAFNAHDLNAILEHYSNDIEFHSPFIRALDFNPDGVIRNKADLKNYFQKGLETYPDLHFLLHHVFAGVDSLVIFYSSVNNLLAAETFWLDQQHRARLVHCHYTANVSTK